MSTNTLRIRRTFIILSLFFTMGQVAMAAEQTTGSENTIMAAETKTSEETENTLTSETISSEEEVSEETSESQTSLTEDSQTKTDSSITEAEVKEIIDSVDTLIEEQIGKQTGKVTQEDFEFSASNIREMLEKDDYGITKDALDKYTDRQLEDTMLLFERYNYDITGMDFGSYVRLLNTLYVDQTVSIEDALAQLSFNPKSFKSFADMIPEVERLQTYLSILYPPNSTFIAAEKMTTDKLIETLHLLNTFEKEYMINEEFLPAGRIIMIINRYKMLENPTTDSTSDLKEENTNKSDSVKKEDKKETGLRLPQTGEGKAKLALSIVGILVIVAGMVLLVKRNNKSKNN